MEVESDEDESEDEDEEGVALDDFDNAPTPPLPDDQLQVNYIFKKGE